MDTPPSCSCAGPGWCPRYRQLMPPHLHGLCAGTGCTPAESAAYRADWDATGGPLRLPLALLGPAPVAAPSGTAGGTGPPLPRKYTPRLRPCVYLGPWTGRLCEN